MNDTSLSTFEFLSMEELLTVHPLSYLIGIALVTLTTYAWATSNPSLKRLPYINPPSFFSNSQAKVSKILL